MANKHIFTKVLGAEMTGKKTDRHGEWYHFHENAWSWNDKMGKLIVTARLA